MEYTVRQARAHFLRLLEEVSRGKEVIIARGKKPIAKLVAIESQPKKRVPGLLAGKLSYTADAFAPLTDQELSDLGFE